MLVTLHYQNDSFEFDALVCREIGDLMICGNPLMSQDIIPNPADKCIEIADIRLLLDQNSEAKIQRISGTLQNKVSLYPKPKPTVSVCQVDKVVLDPDNVLTDVQRAKAQFILKDHRMVFTSKAGKYNGALGNLDTKMTLNNNDNIYPCPWSKC